MQRLKLAGERFGKLTVLREAGLSKFGNVIWSCRCDCGEACDVKGWLLRSGKTTSCGCRPRGKPRSAPLDTGYRCGGVVVTGSEWDKSQKRWAYFYKCDCGALGKCVGRRIGSLKSCGCKRNWRGYKEISGLRWSAVQRGASSREIPFCLTIEKAWEIFEKQSRKCALSGVPIYFDKGYKGPLGTASLDRIDSSAGYAVGNVQWVHKDINRMKMDLTQDDFIKLCARVAERAKNAKRTSLSVREKHSQSGNC